MSNAWCPNCNHSFEWPPTSTCDNCGVDLTGDTATEIFNIDRQTHQLNERRQQLLTELQPAGGAPADLPPPTPAEATAPAASSTSNSSVLSNVKPQTLLAAAGAIMLLAAAIVFAAVTWPTWPIAARGLLLVALTVAGGYTTRHVSARGLEATAASLGVVTVGLAAITVHAAHSHGLADLDTIPTSLWFTLLSVAVAAAAWPFTRWANLQLAVRRTGAVAATVATAAALTWIGDHAVPDHLDPIVGVLPALPLLAAALHQYHMWILDRRWVKTVARLVPGMMLVATAIVSGIVDPADTTAVAAATSTGLGVGLLALFAHQHHDRRGVWWWAAIAGSIGWLLHTTANLLTPHTFEQATQFDWPQLATFTVLAVLTLAATQLPPLQLHAKHPTVTAAAAGLLPAALMTLHSAAGQALTVLDMVVEPYNGWPEGFPLNADLLLLLTATVVGVAAVTRAVRPRLVAPVAAAAGLGGALVVAVSGAAEGLQPTWLPAAVAATATVAAAVWWHQQPHRWEPAAVGWVATLVLSAVSLPLAATSTAVAAVYYGWVTAQTTDTTRHAAAAATLAASLAAVVTTGDLLGLSTASLAVTAAALAVLVNIGSHLMAAHTSRVVAWHHPTSDTVVGITLLLSLTATAAAESAVATAIVFALTAVLAAVHARLPERSWMAWLSSASASCASWVLLADSSIGVAEAYTLPAAATLAAAGAWRLHTTDTSSFAALWPACTLAAAPTLWHLADAPVTGNTADLLRLLLAAALGTLVALVGQRLRLAAPLVAGTLTAVAAAGLQLWHWSAYLPRWVTFGLLGLLLVWASATYETQQQRIRTAKRHVAQLR